MRLISTEGLKAKGIAISQTQLWRLMKAGHFPRPVPLGTRHRVWLESEIDAWIMERVEERDRGADH